MSQPKLSIKLTPESIGRQIAPDYADSDVIIIDDIGKISPGAPLHMDMVVMLVCMAGRAQVDINGRTHQVGIHQMVICPPNVYLNNCLFSADFACKLIGISYTALQRMLHINKDIWQMMVAVTASPVFDIDAAMAQLMMNYYTLLQNKMSAPESPHRQQSMHALMQAIFYDLCDVVRSRMPSDTESSSSIRQGDILVKKFLRMLADSQGAERNVAHFASELCVTPKYLSSVCKKSTGRTAKEWIQEYTVEVLRHQLLHTDLSIKEIAQLLGFPNMSVFGKFVRSTLGQSPSAIRASAK